jgi:hypothetical protein
LREEKKSWKDQWEGRVQELHEQVEDLRAKLKEEEDARREAVSKSASATVARQRLEDEVEDLKHSLENTRNAKAVLQTTLVQQVASLRKELAQERGDPGAYHNSTAHYEPSNVPNSFEASFRRDTGQLQDSAKSRARALVEKIASEAGSTKYSHLLSRVSNNPERVHQSSEDRYGIRYAEQYSYDQQTKDSNRQQSASIAQSLVQDALRDAGV